MKSEQEIKEAIAELTIKESLGVNDGLDAAVLDGKKRALSWVLADDVQL